MRRGLFALSAATMLALMPLAALQAQGTTKDKAPKGCVRCEELCNWCVSLGRQAKDKLAGCHQGCRSWGAMVGLTVVYVQKNRSLCGTSSYAPRCN